MQRLPRHEPVRKFLFLYIAALIASHVVVAFTRITLPEGQRLIALGNGVSIAYVDTAPFDSELPVLLLIHGSPIDVSLFDPLIQKLRQKFRVVAPVLPGFGASSRDLPDYSIRAHALYLDGFMRQAGFPAAHVVGYSMGSGVAIELAHLNAKRMLSLTLLSGIGAQEHELLGNYHLNHALHGVQLAVFWALDHLLPHFGALRIFPLNYHYARNFYDTDQRPLKKYLSAASLPTLILHGAEDIPAPVAAAYAHHELIAQSTLTIFPNDGHLMVYEKPAEIAAAITTFAERVEQGTWSASPKQFKPQPGAGAWFLLILLALATLVREDLAAISAGILAANENISFVQANAAVFAGIFTGGILLVLLRWFFGSNSLIGRIIRGERRAVFYVASFLWSPLIVGIGYVAGACALDYLERCNGSVLLVFILFVVLIFLIRNVFQPLCTWKGRRLLYSSWLRLIHWEFWPPFVFYIPVGFYFVFLIVRYRSFTLFTASNPAIEDGGVIGESKAAILYGLARAGKNIARFILLAPAAVEERMRALSDFRRRQKLKFPVVLKPDAGERGNEVAIIRSDREAREYLTAHTGATIAQEYIPGLEFGVFYFRYPQSPHGRIFAITDKRFPVLTGDGKNTLERLILNDARAVMMARFHLQKFAPRLAEVIPAGEKIQLVELGTHCKGSLFLDGGHLLTPALEREIDKISHAYEGFYFGRYDIRVPSVADFKRGKNLKVVELNGVTSEATSIYDPKHSLLHAYCVLIRQWRIAFEIGRQNAARGAKVTTVSDLLRRLFFVRRNKMAL